MSQCKICKDKRITSFYLGETHTLWWNRHQDHMVALRRHESYYATIKHMDDHCPEDVPNFMFKMLATHKSILQRKLMEAILITETDCVI